MVGLLALVALVRQSVHAAYMVLQLRNVAETLVAEWTGRSNFFQSTIDLGLVFLRLG